MKRVSTAALGFASALALGLLAPAAAHDRGEPGSGGGSTPQERLDRDLSRIDQRTAETAARTAEERAKIEARAAEDPTKAAEDLAKLDADTAKESQKIEEDRTKAEADFTENAAKAAEDAARADSSGEDGGNHGSSRDIADLGSSEGADHDRDGFAVKAGELVATSLSPDRQAAAEAAGFKVIGTERLEALNRDIVHFAVPPGTELSRGLDQLRALAPDATVDLVHYYGLGLTAGERGKPVRRGTIAAGAAQPITVGLIDTAVAAHPALSASRLVAWQSGVLPGAPLEHGTAVASLLAAEGRGPIYSANIFRGPADRPFTSADVIARALEWMIEHKVGTINMSLAGPRNAVLDNLVREALGRGYVIVAAAGNGGPTAPPAYPAALKGVIAVTAVDGNRRIYRYAQQGTYITVAAPGVDVIAANAHGGYARFTGTSFATPRIAGWMARCRSGGASAGECQTRLKRSARDLGPSGFDNTYGFGLID
jgi:hypothetical protein